jgi:hypothetical protein
MGSAVASLASFVAEAPDVDAARVMERADVPRVRRSLIIQLIDAHFAKVGQSAVKPFERMAIATFGTSIADDLANKQHAGENVSFLFENWKRPVHR